MIETFISKWEKKCEDSFKIILHGVFTNFSVVNSGRKFYDENDYKTHIINGLQINDK